MSNTGTPICLHPENPRYFLYKGRPLVLITATEHYGAVLNRNFNYVIYLNEATDKKTTLSRCFLLFRELESIPLNPHSPCKPLPGEYVAPFLRTGPGYATDGFLKFDLNQWDPLYFERLHGFLGEAAQRDIIVELTLFSNTYSAPVWNLNPFNIRNNINLTGDIPWRNYNSMRDDALFEQQKAYVRKIVREVNRYDNFYFEVCNEPFGDDQGHARVAEVAAWHDAIREVVRKEEATLPKRHMVFQVPIERARGGCELDPLVKERTIDAITLHDYHQMSYKKMAFHPLARFMQRDLKLERIHHLWTMCHDAAKPLIFDEDNAATNGLDEEAWTIHRKRAWTTVCSGGHYDMIDFSIQVGGQEAGTPASRASIRNWMKHLSTFIQKVDIVHTIPVRDFCTRLPEATLAATLINPGKEYVVYVADKREKGEEGQGESCSGTLAFTLPAGSYEVRLYQPVSGEYSGQVLRVEGGDVSLALEPFVQDIVVQITAVR